MKDDCFIILYWFLPYINTNYPPSWISLPLCTLSHPSAAAKLRQLCPTLCDPTDGSPTGSSVPGILQARILEWVAISFSKAWKWKVNVKSLSHVWLFATPGTVAYYSSIRGIFWARVLEWVAISFSRGSAWPRDRIQVSLTVGRLFTVWATKKWVRKYSLLFSLLEEFVKDWYYLFLKYLEKFPVKYILA